MKIIRLFFILVIVTGVIYPFFVYLIGNLFFPHQSKGSLIIKNGVTIGSELIGQKFENDKYFHGRPSACNWQAVPSFASNLGPTSNELKKLVEERRLKLGSLNPPADLLFASGSGLDPHISLKAALFQVKRISNERKIDEEILIKLINDFKESSLFRFEPIINVLNLNLKLDQEEVIDHE